MAIIDQGMRILRQDAGVLEFENRPIFWAGCMAAIFLVFVAGGIGALANQNWSTGLIALGLMIPFYWFVFPEVVQLLQVRLDRADGLVRVRLTTLKGRREGQYLLAALRKAEIETRYGASGNAPDHTITLVFEGGSTRKRVPLKVFRLNPEVAIEMTGTINEWLNRGRESKR